MIFNIPSEDTGKDIVSLKSSVTATQRMSAPVLQSMVATSNLYVGDYVVVSNKLFRITANIANGGTIVDGTNATRILNAVPKIIVNEANNISFAERENVDLATLNITAGTWLLVGSHQISTASNDAYQNAFMQSSTTLGITRNIPGGSGGGATTTGIYTTNTSGYIQVRFVVYGYGTAGTSRTATNIKVVAIRLF